eukprot:TRINITY_DN2898_c0_g1_i1.p2 TRINITY_DN2898_c0_g1~~TRINITY_DN2898_c0_g1_i1.p2  ORF type:complete len:117 (+),score=8.40 TRINITY_DN2898_c0_g1_i1:390-740(+)
MIVNTKKTTHNLFFIFIITYDLNVCRNIIIIICNIKYPIVKITNGNTLSNIVFQHSYFVHPFKQHPNDLYIVKMVIQYEPKKVNEIYIHEIFFPPLFKHNFIIWIMNAENKREEIT